MVPPGGAIVVEKLILRKMCPYNDAVREEKHSGPQKNIESLMDSV